MTPTTQDRIIARRTAERAALRPVQRSMRDAGHDLHPPHRADPYSNDFLIVCRSCGAQTQATLHTDGDGGRIAEVTSDSATAIACPGGHR